MLDQVSASFSLPRDLSWPLGMTALLAAAGLFLLGIGLSKAKQPLSLRLLGLVLGTGLGSLIGWGYLNRDLGGPLPPVRLTIPLPHTLPIRDGTPGLRFAMIRDALEGRTLKRPAFAIPTTRRPIAENSLWHRQYLSYRQAVGREPALLRQSDWLGFQLDPAPEALSESRPTDAFWQSDPPIDLYFKIEQSPNPQPWITQIRAHIRDLGPELSRAPNLGIQSVWRAESGSHLPFDQAVLGILAIWQQGEGPNPHLALGLAEILRRVGAPDLAWEAYTRAAEMADAYGKSPQDGAWLKTYTQAAQQNLEKQADLSGIPARYKQGKAAGQQLQKQFAQFIQAQLAAGKTLDTDFESLFAQTQPAVAPDPADQMTLDLSRYLPRQVWPLPLQTGWLLAWAVFWAGLFTWLFAQVRHAPVSRSEAG